eukprot:7699-Heterococcus_DN1.PRE.2
MKQYHAKRYLTVNTALCDTEEVSDDARRTSHAMCMVTLSTLAVREQSSFAQCSRCGDDQVCTVLPHGEADHYEY